MSCAYNVPTSIGDGRTEVQNEDGRRTESQKLNLSAFLRKGGTINDLEKVGAEKGQGPAGQHWTVFQTDINQLNRRIAWVM